MFLLFEEAGKLLAARVLSQAESSAQVELDSGKRVKVKAANILLAFDKPAPAALLQEARAVAEGIELDLAWEFAPADEFGFAELAREYFSDQATPVQQVGALISLFEAPHYFRRVGKGRFRKASAEVLAQALAAIEKKKRLLEQIDAWTGELVAGRCPQPVREQLYRILFRPDKNAAEYKAVVEAARATHLAPLVLLQRAGAIDSPYQFHWRRFLFEHFPKGIGFPELALPPVAEELPLAPVQAFSIDDSSTSEIDDALSVSGLGSGRVTVGIHIAAPGLVVAPGDPIDRVARERLSTVYLPGYKVTMLPPPVVQACTLQEGRDCPAVSLYVTFDEEGLALAHSQTRLERVPVRANLRHDQIDTLVTPQWLLGGAPGSAVPDVPALSGLRDPLRFLHRLAVELKARREVVRGKPETFGRPDYSFKLLCDAPGVPDGSETVAIGVRERGAPLDLIVSEAMILANNLWGDWLAELGVPAIYRSQASLAPGVKVRMGARPLPHAGLGVRSYAWSTSPLRRYTDLVNQWQIIACARHGKAAALAAPFKPRDAELFAVISGFDAAYGAYGAFQAAIERFWTLRYLEQNEIRELVAVVFKDNLVRAETLPLVLPVIGAQDLPRGARVRVRLGAPDTIALDVTGSVVERLDAAAQADGAGSDAAAFADEEEDEGVTVAGPLAIALDLADAADAAQPQGDNPPP